MVKVKSICDLYELPTLTRAVDQVQSLLASALVRAASVDTHFVLITLAAEQLPVQTLIDI